jgi:hypothetical protein
VTSGEDDGFVGVGLFICQTRKIKQTRSVRVESVVVDQMMIMMMINTRQHDTYPTMRRRSVRL